MNALSYVGAAYAVVWILICAYLWRLTAMSSKLADKLDELERRQG
jgi:CcmD family protein